METKHLKKYAPEARRDFIAAVKNKAAMYGLLPKEILSMQEEGDVVIIGDRPFPRSVAKQRKELEDRILKDGFQQFIEAIAYTWFNRFVAIRYMELHGYLDHGYRVLSHPEGKSTPEILDNAERIELPGLKRDEVVDLKLDGGKDEQLYQVLLLAQCNAMHKAMPFLFESIKDGTELLLPDNLLHTDSLVRTLVNDIPEEQWGNVEIIGWLYQFYISEKKDEVIGKIVKSEDIPAATQLFTPNWIVKYLIQNSLGRQWMATYPDSPLKRQMEFYIEPVEQTAEVQQQLAAITPDSLNPEELTLLDPACGSGHILAEAYDLFKAIYEERGYRARDIPKLILSKNLFGLEIDARAAQLSAFSLMMKARADDRSIFSREAQLNVVAIHDSNTLDASEITGGLNEPVLKGEQPSSGELFDEIADEKAPLFSKKHLAVKGEISQDDIRQLIQLFEHGQIFGSLIDVPMNLAQRLPSIVQRVEEVLAHGGMLEKATARSVLPLLRQAHIISLTYDAVVANPPYLGSKHLNPELKGFADTFYPEGKSDLFAFFVLRMLRWIPPNKHLAAMTPFTWMFIKSYESLRRTLVQDNVVTTLVQPEYHAFFDSAFVPICAFVVQHNDFRFKGTFFDLSEFYGEEAQPTKVLEAIQQEGCSWKHNVDCHDFEKIPGSPVAYWASEKVRDVCHSSDTIELIANPMQGSTLGDNDRFLRFWYEVSHSKIPSKWVPCIKGGKFRKWHGNNLFVVNWENEGQEVKETGRATIRNEDFFFRKGIEWNRIGSSIPAFRSFGEGFVYESASGIAFPDDPNYFDVLGFLNSKVSIYLLKCINPTLNVQSGDIARLPFATVDSTDVVQKLVGLAEDDWNEMELSCDFQTIPVLASDAVQATVFLAYASYCEVASKRREDAASLETENNQRFISAFGLIDELSPGVPSERITLCDPDKQECVENLVSYAIGCMMGRYSLDERGLIYAHSGNDGFDPSKYTTFPADEDGIIPITDMPWFPDDAANRFEQFISTAWPENHLEENLKFVAESLDQKKGETSRDCIRRYLATGFYKHHLSMYKKRPVYWLFSSGKQRAFQCLVYLHRYNAGTLSRMRTEYVVKLQGKVNTRIEQLEDDIPVASSTSHRKKLEKERDKLIKRREELQEFDEKLRHYADQRIDLDLDDGVKVNYGKFGDLLAEVKTITGKKPKVEVTT